MGSRKLAKFVDVFIKAAQALTEQEQEQIKIWKGQMEQIIRNVIPSGVDPEDSANSWYNSGPAKEYRELKRKIRSLTSRAEGSYKQEITAIRDNRALVQLLERIQGQAGVDRGLFQSLSSEIAKHNISPQSMVVMVEIGSQTPPNFKVTGGSSDLQKYVLDTINASQIPRIISSALASDKSLVPSNIFTYELVRLP